MTDYGHPLQFGAFVTPSVQAADQVLALARLAEQVGLDLITFQDHPYQPAFLDTFTLLSYVAAQTSTISVSGNVLNLPLRPPAMLAKSAATLDILSGGRFELGLGAGAFWDGIAGLGGRRLAPGESVRALEEAIGLIREIWDVDQRGGVRLAGEFYSASGAKRGPAPAHPIGIWLGAYKPKMLALVGRAADGWLPSLGYLQPDQLAGANKIIDEAAEQAGRDPRAIRRLLNVNADSAAPERLAEFALNDGISTFILMGDDAGAIQRLGAELAPAVRELVAAERAADPTTPPDEQRAGGHRDSPWELLGYRPTPDPGVRLAAEKAWDESTRPRLPERIAERGYSTQGAAIGRHLIDVHDHLRQELETVRDVLAQVSHGAMEAGAARSVINELTLRQNNWTLGAYCESYCRVVTQHHSIEDASVFPHLRSADRDLAPVLDRLTEEHHVIHEVLELLDARLVQFIAAPQDYTGLQDAVDLLTDTLLSHLAYEEGQLIEPLARLGFYNGQL